MVGWLLASLALAGATPQASPPSPRPEFVTLGTGGGPVVQAKRGQPANAVMVGDAVYLFDAGEGTQRRMKLAGLRLSAMRAVFLSHHHLDHVGGLASLLVNRWVQRLTRTVPVIGPPGTSGMVAGIVAASLPIERAPLDLSVRPTDSGPRIAATISAEDLPGQLAAPTEVYRDDHIRVLAISVDHYHDASGAASSAASSYAFRIEVGGHAAVYSGDTGPSPGLERLARGADLLVSEVVDRPAIAAALAATPMPAAARDGFLRHMQLDHLSPAEVGTIAHRAGVGRLVLTHLVPGRDQEIDTAGYLTGIASQFNGPVTVARDGERFAF